MNNILVLNAATKEKKIYDSEVNEVLKCLEITPFYVFLVYSNRVIVKMEINDREKLDLEICDTFQIPENAQQDDSNPHLKY